ncbi:hypothetical protein GQX74_009070 [Glossina fuscipes]|nr:hypothetical protein GQX74_009070 [Glossina fuscipes]
MLRDTTTTQFKEDVNIIKMEVFIFENSIYMKHTTTKQTVNSVEHGELYDDKWLRMNITFLIALNDFPFRSMRLRHSILSPAAISNFPIMQLLYYNASLVLFTFKNGGHLLKK